MKLASSAHETGLMWQRIYTSSANEAGFVEMACTNDKIYY